MLWQTLLTWYRGGCGTLTAIKRTNHIRKETLTELPSSLHYYDYMLQLETFPWSCWGSDFGSIQASGVRDRCCQFSLSSSETEPPHKQLGITCNIPPRHAGRPACLNIRSHPEAWESRRSEPVRAAALCCLEGVDRVSRGAYSHRGCVSFGVTCSCAFCLQLWLVKLHLVKCVSDGHVCLPRWEEEHFL